MKFEQVMVIKYMYHYNTLWVTELPGVRWPPCPYVRLRWPATRTRHMSCVSLVGWVSLAHLPSALGNTSHGGHLESRGEVGGGGGKGINETHLPSPGDSLDYMDRPHVVGVALYCLFQITRNIRRLISLRRRRLLRLIAIRQHLVISELFVLFYILFRQLICLICLPYL